MAERNDLASYITDVVYKKFKDDRQQLLESKWERNYHAYSMISDEFWKAGETKEWRSKTFVPAIRTKVLLAWSLIIDLLLMSNRIPFDLKPSPWDEVAIDDMPVEEQDALKKAIHDFKALIDQQFVDCKFDRHLMKMVMSDAIYGECYAKFYVYQLKRTVFAPEDVGGGQARYSRREIKKNAPGVEYWSVWDVFRDLTSDDLQEGRGVIFRALWSPYKLRSQKEEMYYFGDVIDEVLADNTRSANAMQESSTYAPERRDLLDNNDITMLEFWGRAPRAVVEAFEYDRSLTERQYEEGEPETEQDLTERQYEDDGDEVEIMCLLANDKIVRFSRNEENHRPVYRGIWQEKLDAPYGEGVADNGESLQLVLNGYQRLYEDNKKLSANVMGIGNFEKAPDWDGTFKPGMLLDVDDTVSNVGQAWEQIIVTDVGESLLNGKADADRMFDDATMLPKILQGAVLDKRKPDTFGEMNMLQANAGKYIGGVIRNLDEGCIENVCQDFYEYDMDDPDLQIQKGNFIAQALGYSSYQDRIVRVSKIIQALNLVSGSEEFMRECKLNLMLEETFKSLDLDYNKFVKSREEKIADMQAEQQSPEYRARQAILANTVQASELKNVDTATKIDHTAAQTQEIKDRTALDGFKAGADIGLKKNEQERADAIQDQGQGGGKEQHGQGRRPQQESQEVPAGA